MQEIFDVGLTASIGYFIRPHVMKQFTMGMLNAHPSLLPKYRGAAPIVYTIIDGKDQAGVSIIDLDCKEFDAGNIWLQEQFSIEPYSGFEELENRLGKLSGELFHKILYDYGRFNREKQPQQGEISFAPKVAKELASVSFSQMTRWDIFGKFQGLHHRFMPFAWVKTQDRKREVSLLRILHPTKHSPRMDAQQFSELTRNSPLGAIFYERTTGTLWIRATDGWLGTTKIKFSNHPVVYDAGNFVQVAGLTSPFSSSYFS